ncbi:MAG: hypothetical protein HQL40_20805 [Alphaproteobacteria bacterium]|nr:hypothetical protein [Alphaproteobacteria bacterium]
MATLEVGNGKQYATISDAVAATRDGDTVLVQAGVYQNDFPVVNSAIGILGVGGMVHLKATQSIPNGKAIMIVNDDVTLRNLEFSGARVSAGNGAGIRYQAGQMRIENSNFHDNQNGILAASSAAGTIAIDHTEFARNGTGNGYTHALYVNKIAKLSVTDSYFHDTNEGHHIKSRAFATVVENSRLIDGLGGTSSYSVDLPNGGDALLRGNLMVQAATGGNPTLVNYGGDTLNPDSRLVVADNVMASHMDVAATGVFNRTKIAASVTGNDFYHVAKETQGAAVVSDSVALSQAPVVDTSSPWAEGPVANPDAVLVSPSPSPLAPPDTGLATTTLNGTGAADRLNGGSGRDLLDGGAGGDTMAGGAGDDTYRVDSGLDVVIEASGAGIDQIVTALDRLVLANNVENLTLLAGATRGDGNGLANRVVGNDAANLLKGWGGNDMLVGGKGADSLYGGGGRDIFVIDQALGVDRVFDFAAGVDHLDLRPLGAGRVELLQNGAHATVLFNSATVAVVENVEARLLASDIDFLL